MNGASESQPATPFGREHAAVCSAAKANLRRGSNAKRVLQDEGVTVKTEAMHSSAKVSELIEDAALKAFVDVKQVGAGAVGLRPGPEAALKGREL